MMARYQLSILLLIGMMGISTMTIAQTNNTSTVKIDLIYKDADGKKHTESIEYVGQEADEFDAEAYEKSLKDRDIEVLNINISKSVSKATKGTGHNDQDLKIKSKGAKGKKAVIVKKIVVSETGEKDILHESHGSQTYKVEEKDGKLFLNGKQIKGDSKQIRIEKSMDSEEEMKIEVKDGKVFINGKEVDESEMNKSSEHRVIIKSIGSDDDHKSLLDGKAGKSKQIRIMKTMEGDDDVKVEVRDDKVYINGEEVDESEMDGSSEHRVIIKSMDSIKHPEPGEYSDHVIIKKGDLDLAEENIWISKDDDEIDIEKMMIHLDETNGKMIFISDEDNPQKPRLGVMIEDGKEVNGAAIANVVPDSPAAKAGLKKGDTVTAVNDESVYGVTSMMDKVAGFKNGDEVKITYSRGGKTMSSSIKLEMMDTMMEKHIFIKEEKH